MFDMVVAGLAVIAFVAIICMMVATAMPKSDVSGRMWNLGVALYSCVEMNVLLGMLWMLHEIANKAF